MELAQLRRMSGVKKGNIGKPMPIHVRSLHDVFKTSVALVEFEQLFGFWVFSVCNELS